MPVRASDSVRFAGHDLAATRASRGGQIKGERFGRHPALLSELRETATPYRLAGVSATTTS